MNPVVTFTTLLLVGLAVVESVTFRVWTDRWATRQITVNLPVLLAVGLRAGATVLAAVAVFTVYPGRWQYGIAAAALAWLTVLAVQTDLSSSKIPREACHAVAFVGLGMCVVTWPGPAGWLNLALALLTCVVVPFIASAFLRGGLGLGDVRLLWAWAACAGWWLGFVPLAWALIAGSLIGVVVHVAAIRFEWGTVTNDVPAWVSTATEDGTTTATRKPRRHVPFAPSLATGLVLAVAYAMTVGIDACSSVQDTILTC